MRYLVSLLLLSGCVNGVDQSKKVEELDLLSIDIAIERFEEEFGLNVMTTVTFSEDPYNGVAATCAVEINHITINKDIWVDLSTATRESVVFHELGHCIMGLGHTDEITIMSSFLGFSALEYINNYEESVAIMANSKCEYSCGIISDRMSK